MKKIIIVAVSVLALISIVSTCYAMVGIMNSDNEKQTFASPCGDKAVWGTRTTQWGESVVVCAE